MIISPINILDGKDMRCFVPFSRPNKQTKNKKKGLDPSTFEVDALHHHSLTNWNGQKSKHTPVSMTTVHL